MVLNVYKASQYSYITIVEIPKDEIAKIDMSLCAQPRQTLANYYKACTTKPDILCNGGLFNMSDGTTCFNYADNGVIISSDANTREGFGIINGILKYGVIGDEPFEDFVSGYPVLIKNKQPVTSSLASEINYRARRTILAYDADTIYIIAIESPGMNFTEVKNFLKTLNVDYAINLDGGGSTKILQNGKSITSSLYNRAVDNVVAVYLKPQVIYRVQLGAFSSRSNADRYLQTIKALGGSYTSAYVRKVGSVYKVQVGAFSVKANATRMVNDLKSKGFNAFITSA